MAKFLKYLIIFFLMVIAASLAMCSFSIYNAVQTGSRLFAGADSYTCRQFNYDMEHPETDKLAPMIFAAVAYGIQDVTPTGPETSQKEAEKAQRQKLASEGIQPAVTKVYALCKNHSDARLLNVFAETIVSPTLTGVSSTVTSSTTQQ